MTPSTAIRLTGADVLTVLHRVSTQRLEDLAVGESRPSLLCDFRGRLQHRFVVARAHGGEVWLLRSDAGGESLASALDRAVFREDVRIEDASHRYEVRAIAAGSAPAPAESTPGPPLWVAEGDGVALLVSEAGDGSRAGIPALDPAACIALGRARHGHEITEEHNPFEVGLSHAVHLDKGCFTGQEALQRLITYASVRRQLAVLQGSGDVPETPIPVLASAQDAGRITSIAAHPGGWRGLAVMRRAALESSASFALADGREVLLERAFEPGRPLGRP